MLPPNYYLFHLFYFILFLKKAHCSQGESPQPLGCVRLGNPDLDFQNLNPDFPIEREIRKRISPFEKSVLRVDFN